jgi:hypothetical protein
LKIPLSLKGLIPKLAEEVEMTPAALYERQRALVRAGLLQGEAGRGPGSGVRATPKSVALLLISLTGSHSETEEHSKIVAGLKSEGCSLTGETTFANALAAALASEDTAQRIRWIEVERGGSKTGAAIVYRPRGTERVFWVAMDILGERDHQVESQFGFRGASRASALGTRVSLSLDFAAIAHDLKEGTK